jgi:Flavodoxin
MRALVVFESSYGNTARIAEEVGAGLREGGADVEVVPVAEAAADRVRGADLLVVGGPTHMHGMSRTGTRQVAVKDEKNTYPSPTVGPGLREWLGELPSGDDRAAAAFDTRLDNAMVFTGSAAKGIGRGLSRHGYREVAEHGSFLVTKDNTLKPGELQRARAWGASLAAVAVTG